MHEARLDASVRSLRRPASRALSFSVWLRVGPCTPLAPHIKSVKHPRAWLGSSPPVLWARNRVLLRGAESTRGSQGSTRGRDEAIPEPDTQGRASSSQAAGPRPHLDAPEADSSTFLNRHVMIGSLKSKAEQNTLEHPRPRPGNLHFLPNWSNLFISSLPARDQFSQSQRFNLEE